MSTACRIADLQCKEVVNLCDGARLGYVSDVEIDICSGQLTAIVVPGECGVLSFLSKGEEYVIPWHDIEKIGDDIILVKYTAPFRPPKDCKKKHCFRF